MKIGNYEVSRNVRPMRMVAFVLIAIVLILIVSSTVGNKKQSKGYRIQPISAAETVTTSVPETPQVSVTTQATTTKAVTKVLSKPVTKRAPKKIVVPSTKSITYRDASGYCVTSGQAEAAGKTDEASCHDGSPITGTPVHYRGLDGFCATTGQAEAQAMGVVEDETCK